jgi:hypothetical protein
MDVKEVIRTRIKREKAVIGNILNILETNID